MRRFALLVVLLSSGVLTISANAQVTGGWTVDQFLQNQRQAIAADEAAARAAEQARVAAEQAKAAVQAADSPEARAAAEQAAKKAEDAASSAAQQAGAASQTARQSLFLPGGGAYSVVGRSNDPFVFCTYGVPNDGWVAVNPMAGTWKVIRKYPNLQWVGIYSRICPTAMSQGAWVGPGSGEQIPFPH